MNTDELESQIELLEQENRKHSLPRTYENKRTTFSVHKTVHEMLRRLEPLFAEECDWRSVNCILIECLRFLKRGDELRSDAIVIPYLERLNHRRILLEGEFDKIAIHRSANAMMWQLKPHFGCMRNWQTFNCALMCCLSSNERLIVACREVVLEEEAA